MGPPPEFIRRTRRQYAGAVLLAGLSATTVHATTLAIIRTESEVVFAADSRMTLHGTRPQQACKIGRRNDVVFATAGLVESSDGVLDTHRIIAEVLTRDVSWTEHVETIEGRLQEPLLRTLRRMQREVPDQFGEQVRRGFALHVSLAAFRQGHAALEMLEFFVELAPDRSLRLRVNRVSCPRDCSPTTSVFGVGETEAMMRQVNGLQRYPADLGALARDLVDLQIRESPAFVGPPVDVIRVSRTGVEWMARKSSCPA